LTRGGGDAGDNSKRRPFADARKYPTMPPRTPIRGPESTHKAMPCRATLVPGSPLRSVRGGNEGCVGSLP